jgi:hypothetical protein
MGTGGSSPLAKRRVVKLTTHLPLVSRLRMIGAIPPHHHHVFMAWFLVKHMDNFTFPVKSQKYYYYYYYYYYYKFHPHNEVGSKGML